jgi:oligosaccharide repeat unit polymerase
MIYLLAIIVFSLLFLTYLGVNRDLMHPSVLTIGATLLCILAAIYNVKLWRIQYHLNTTLIVVVGLFCISVTGMLCAKVKTGKSRKSLQDEKFVRECQPFLMSDILFLMIVCFNLFVLAWYYYIILKITGGGAFTEMLANFRMMNSYGASSDDAVAVPALLNQCIKLNKVLAYIFVMIFLNNLIGYKKKDWKFLLPPVLFCFQTLLGSDRIYIVILAGASVVMAYIIWHRKNGWKRNISGRYLKIAVKSLSVILVFFFGVRNVIGHNKSNKINDPMVYITQYIGGSIQLLDLYVQDPLVESDAGCGEESFSSIYKTIIQLHGETPPKRHMEFRASNGIVIGNIYTAIRKYYHDFGYVGVIILCSIFGLFFGWLYRRLQQERVHHLMSYSLCAYCFIVHCALYFPLDDLFFSGVISINYFTMLIYMWIVYHLVIEKPLKIKVKV